jgi:histone-lysine N-methyltransferase SETMAR
MLKDKLKPAIRSKWRGLLSKTVLLHHDNVQPPAAVATIETIQKLNFELLPHPPYSPDLAPSDYHLFGSLTRLGTKRLPCFWFTEKGTVGTSVRK